MPFTFTMTMAAILSANTYFHRGGDVEKGKRTILALKMVAITIQIL